ncbi:MAG: homoserine kinase [Methylocapsa sp.]|nr:homoserine kinase [Methylocapsa sp.]
MAVYTEVSDADLARFLADYDLGRVLALKGIAEGVENSNYFLHAERGYFILTLYEKRVDEKDLPFFLALMEHLAARGVNCPHPVKNKHGSALGRIADRPAALVTFLEGMWRRNPSVRSCAAAGGALGALHCAGADFPLSRDNSMGLESWRSLFEEARPRSGELQPGLADEIAKELAFLNANWPQHLPRGIIHADLFPDNVLFLDDQVSGLIDFYFACTDQLAYDLAICLNAWCFEPDGSYNLTKGLALLGAYERIRKMSAVEAEAFLILARGAALRFALTRLVDWLNVPANALVHPKDPREYIKKLRFHQQAKSIRELGLLR